MCGFLLLSKGKHLISPTDFFSKAVDFQNKLKQLKVSEPLPHSLYCTFTPSQLTLTQVAITGLQKKIHSYNFKDFFFF